MSKRICLALLTALGLCVVAADRGSGQEDGAAERRLDEAQLVLLEDHINSIESAMKRIAQLATDPQLGPGQIPQVNVQKQAAIRALETIVTDYFLARRIKPSASDDEEAQVAYLSNVTLLHEMVIQLDECKTSNDLGQVARLRELLADFRKSYGGEGDAAAGAERPAETPSAEEPADPAAQLSEAERYIFRICNAYRKKQGLPPLQLDDKLCRSARDHSNDMQRLSFFSHNSPLSGKVRFFDRAQNFGTSAHAENIARDCTTGRMAMELWVNSQYHRANILGSHSRIGIGEKEGYFTQMFGN